MGDSRYTLIMFLLTLGVLIPALPAFLSSIIVDTGMQQAYGAGANPTGNPIGGGVGYDDIITRDDPRVMSVVSTRAQLLTALQSAKAGDVVYINGNANIDMTGTFNVRIPAGVTLASNRGESGSPGGRIYQNRVSNDPTSGFPIAIFKTGGAGVRVTGLRLDGPDETRSSPSGVRCGIVSEHRSFEIDNCEVYGFSHAGVQLRGTGSDSGQYVHHNYIHHCQRDGYGYGIVVENAGALVESNKFDYNRHSIGATGLKSDAYEARYNIVGPNGQNHHFDMHEDPTDPGKAGNWVKIHHNTFQGGSQYAFWIKGVPRTGAWIDHNILHSGNLKYPVVQTVAHGGITMTNNLLGADQVLSVQGPVGYL